MLRVLGLSWTGDDSVARTGTLSKSSSRSLDEEPSGTQSTIPVPTVSDDLGLCWSSAGSVQSRRRQHLPADLRALHASICWRASWRRGFPFSSRTLNLPTVPKLPAAGLVCQPWYHCASFPSKLARTSEIVLRGRWETPGPVQMSWSDVVFKCKSSADQEWSALMDILSECWHLYIKKIMNSILRYRKVAFH